MHWLWFSCLIVNALNDYTTLFLFHDLLFLLATQVWRTDCVLVWKGGTCTQQRRWEPFTLWRRTASSSPFLPLSAEMFRNSAECWYNALWRRTSLLPSLLLLLEYFYSSLLSSRATSVGCWKCKSCVICTQPLHFTWPALSALKLWRSSRLHYSHLIQLFSLEFVSGSSS